MDTIKIARRLAELGQTADAQRAYTLALQAAAIVPGGGAGGRQLSSLFQRRLPGGLYQLPVSLPPGPFSKGTAGADDPGLLPAQCGSSPQAV